ncbi:putative CCR4-associated factor 1 homolog 8 [Cucurbita maxima]|uniref:poly(A)-specific ribonuclease n=1 Tax=Cucurbita maxima TaxID=3661 RepID=A0A6J1I6H7_CUCMA|nr:putative CCR4-associated factor 1 homolog 8 [Cucurbita maxima]XP_022970738.1 putative CCR4-associated factor 1 homolog 8 [Cucurbita maxima]
MDRIVQGPRGDNPLITEVWAYNLDDEILRLDHCLLLYPVMSIDTEFPGCIKRTPWGTIDEELYADFRFNVNQTKVIQLGVTVSDESGNIGGTWEFNFSDFDPEIDAHNPASICFLKQNGLDFGKLKKDGIKVRKFAIRFLYTMRKHAIHQWITFHGLYDIGYLILALGVVKSLPETLGEFEWIVARRVGTVRDLKHMARFCEGLEGGNLGLEKLGQLLDQKRFGLKHHAGSDSLMTALLHEKMLQLYDFNAEICDGFLYGLSKKFEEFVGMQSHRIYVQIKCAEVKAMVIRKKMLKLFYAKICDEYELSKKFKEFKVLQSHLRFVQQECEIGQFYYYKASNIMYQ